MAYDAFLKIEGIIGESTDQTHEGWIDIESFSWGVTNAGSLSGGGGGGAGRASFQDVHFTAPTSKASPNLMLACATGRHFQKAQLSLVKAQGSKGFEFVKLEFDDVLVTSYQSGGASGGEDRPTDAFSLNFVKIDFEYITQNADGSAGEIVEASFDLRAATP